MESRITKFLTMLACLLMGVAIGFVLNYQPAVVISADQSAGTQKYTEIMSLVDNYYIGEDVDETVINDYMAAAMISALGDRWSYYVSAKDYQAFEDNRNNAYVGVGVTVSATFGEDGTLLGYLITEVVDGGPAAMAGVLAGDILVEVDGASVLEFTLSEVKERVRGQEGTEVSLTLLRNEETVIVTAKRSSFTLSPATGMMLAGNVGYIAIDNFDAGCAETVIGLIDALREQGATSLLFDVRNNPGGYKTELAAVLDYLLPEGPIFRSEDYNGEKEVITSDAACVELPMAVLVNTDSYSAAEYFACALQEYGVATVVGENTFGKGYYQVSLPLSDGSCINLSVGKYYTPNGISLIDTGVTPDVEIALDETLLLELAKNQLAPENDPQIQAALNCLLP